MHEDLDTFLEESMHDKYENSIIQKEKAKWHAELYGYIFAASHLNIVHKSLPYFVVNAGYAPFEQKKPTLIRYTVDFSIDDKLYSQEYFSNINLKKCERIHKVNEQYENSTSKTRIISLHTINAINNSLNNFYVKHCDENFNAIEKIDIFEKWSCFDEHEKCKEWSEYDQCEQNKEFMRTYCTVSCNLCHTKKVYVIPNFLLLILLLPILKLYLKFKKKTVEKSHVV